MSLVIIFPFWASSWISRSQKHSPSPSKPRSTSQTSPSSSSSTSSTAKETPRCSPLRYSLINLSSHKVSQFLKKTSLPSQKSHLPLSSLRLFSQTERHGNRRDVDAQRRAAERVTVPVYKTKSNVDLPVAVKTVETTISEPTTVERWTITCLSLALTQKTRLFYDFISLRLRLTKKYIFWFISKIRSDKSRDNTYPQ